MKRLRFGEKILRIRDEPEPTPVNGKTPILFIHGAGMSSVVFMDLLRPIAPSRRVIALDLPGHGQSDPWHTPSLAMYADVVGTVCAHLGLKKIIVAGHSMGGLVALHCARSFPERIAGLVLISSAARLSVPKELFLSLERELPAAETALVESMPTCLRDLSFSASTPKDLVQKWQGLLFQTTRQVLLQDLVLCADVDLSDTLHKLDLPSLIIGGQDDLLVSPSRILATHKAIRSSQLELFPYAGHFPHLERSEDFVKILRGFLSSL